MEPEEKIKREIKEILVRLKTEQLRTTTDQPIEYWVHYGFFGEGVLAGREEEQILKKIEEMGAIEILSSGWEYE